MRTPVSPRVMALLGLVMLARLVPGVLLLKAKRRLRGLWTRTRLVPPIALALVACSGAAQKPATIAEAQPAAVVAYEAGVFAWSWLDGQNAGQFVAVASSVREGIAAQREAYEEKCGDRAAECQLADYDQIIRAWEEESGYLERTGRLERVREALALLRETLAGPVGQDVGSVTAKAADALRILLDELRANNVKIPEPVMAAPGLLRGIQ